jgi:hypothetical protein
MASNKLFYREEFAIFKCSIKSLKRTLTPIHEELY